MVMKRILTNIFGEPQTHFYCMFLKNNDEVKESKPKLVKKLADDIDLELYVGDSGNGKNTWATAVIKIQVGEKDYRTKYDSGRIMNDLDVMAEECLLNIRVHWDLDYWRKEAIEEINSQTRWIDKYLED